VPSEPEIAKPEKKVKLCPCGNVIRYWRYELCDVCDPEHTSGKPSKLPRRPPPNPRPPDQPSGAGSIGEPKVADTRPNGRVSKRGVLNDGAPTKASDETLAAILDDMAQYGMTQQQAAAGHGVSPETFSRWKADPKYEGLRDRAQYIQIKNLMAKFENAPPGEYKRFAWLLEKIYRLQYGDPAKIGVQVNQQFNGGGPAINAAQLEETRKGLDKIDLWQAHWRAGTASDVELRECLVMQRDQAQHVINLIDAGTSPDQSTQQDLCQRFHEERGNRDPRPVQEAVGRIVSPDPLAIEDAEPEQRATSGTVMRASDLDPLSGVAEPAEPPVNKPITGPLSTRQRWAAQERARRGGEGKQPW
jgi:hypothetical protein